MSTTDFTSHHIDYPYEAIKARLPNEAPEDFAIPELGQRKASEKRNAPPGAFRRFLNAMRPGATA